MHKKPNGEIDYKDVLVIDTANDFDSPEQSLAVAHASDPGPFLLGCRELWAKYPDRKHRPGELTMEQRDFTKFHSFKQSSNMFGT